MAVEMGLEKELSINNLMKKAMANNEIKKHSKEASHYAKKLTEELTKRGSDELAMLNLKVDERAYLLEAKDFLKHELSCEIEIYSQDDDKRDDPKDKAKFAVPFRPAIYVK
jgi:hypothetical protein